MPDYLEDAKRASNNNPAGRAVKCLAPILAQGRQVSMGGALADALGTNPGALEFPLLCAALRMEIYSIQGRVAPYLLSIRGARHSFEGFDTVLSAADLLLRADQIPEANLRQTISEMGWRSLCWADDIMAQDSTERALEQDEASDLLVKVRELIDDILNGDEFSQEEKLHMVGLLRDLESALIGVRIRGSGPVERATKAIIGDAVSRPDIWSREVGKNRKATIAKIVGVVMMIAALFGAYPGAKELSADLFQQLAIAAMAHPAEP